MIPKIERDFVAADLAAVEALLAQMTDEDVLSTMSLEARRDELRQALASLAASPESAASAALFFSGRPVVGNRGIEAEFGTEATHDYQDIVNKVFAYRQSGRLGQRGTVPGKDLSKLYITQNSARVFRIPAGGVGPASRTPRLTVEGCGRRDGAPHDGVWRAG